MLFYNYIFFSTDDINYFYNNNNKKVTFFVEKIKNKILILFTISKLFRFYLGLFLTDKYTIKEVIKLEKDDENNLKNETKKLVKCTKIK